jgi:hypothetical protein
MKLSHALLASLLVASSLAPPAVAAPAVGDSKSSKSSKSKNASEPGPRIVEAADRRAFYRGGWRTLLHRRVHLHVETEVLRHAPQRSGANGRWLRFDNRSVALVMRPRMEEGGRISRCLEFACRDRVVCPAGSRALLEVD